MIDRKYLFHVHTTMTTHPRMYGSENVTTTGNNNSNNHNRIGRSLFLLVQRPSEALEEEVRVAQWRLQWLPRVQ